MIPQTYAEEFCRPRPVEKRALCILQVSTYDINGGAEKVAWDLFHSYQRMGHDSWLAVGRKRSDEGRVIALSGENKQRLWSRLWLDVESQLKPYERNARNIARVCTVLRMLANPRRELRSRFGIENFAYPETHSLLELPPQQPEIVHCHNLHGDYFDLRALRSISHRSAVVLTLHDAWLLSGHCSHSFECERWKSGCGECPDLAIYPAISRDATSYNWRRKRRIFENCRLNISTPCRWLMEKVEQSILAPAIKQARIIPYGIDLAVFCPASKETARIGLGFSQDAEIVLFTANGIRRNIFKDYQTMRAAIARVAEKSERRIVFVALGENGGTERIGSAEVVFVPYQKDPMLVARYYQAADIYLHGAKVDTFPNTVLEALACGTPVVATAVGGIPEQVKTLNVGLLEAQEIRANRNELENATGILTKPGDAEQIACAIEHLLANPSLRMRLGENAAIDAARRFDLGRETEEYLDWYEEILADFESPNRTLANGRKCHQ